MATQKALGFTTTPAERKKADAWLNLNLPVKSKSTGQVKMKSLGGIPLDSSNALHAKLIDSLKNLNSEDITAVVSELLSKGLISLVIPDSEDNDDFELGA